MDEDFEMIEENKSNLTKNNSSIKNNNISNPIKKKSGAQARGASRLKNTPRKTNLGAASSLSKGTKGSNIGIKKRGSTVSKGILGNKTLKVGKTDETGEEVATAGIGAAGKALEKKSEKKKQQPQKNETEESINKAIKATGKVAKFTTKLMIIFWPITLGLAIALFIIYLIIGPLADAWSGIDRGARNVANTIEKLTNFYQGFGYEDSKTAFFKEVDHIDEFYDNQLDLPLLMSTLFYPEIMGYDTSYQDHLDVMNGDPVTETLSGGPSAFISFMSRWIKDILDEAKTTYDENGLAYNAGKIYRLRRLSAAMCKRSDVSKDITLEDFVNMMGDQLGKAFKDWILTTFNSIIKAIGATFEVILSTIINTVTFQFDKVANSWGDYFDQIKGIAGNEKNALAVLLSVISFGMCTITRIHYDLGGSLMIEYYPYEFDQSKYDEYVKNYYFENTPEFKKMLPANQNQRNEEKSLMLSEIYTNRDLFKELFFDYEDEVTEGYQANCVGGLNVNLVSNLRLPVDIPENIKVDFSSDTAFGIRNAQKHNGVDLNTKTAGVSAGSNVYAVAAGKVVDISCSKKNSTSSGVLSNLVCDSYKIKLEHTLDADNKEFKFYSIYSGINLTPADITESKGELTKLINKYVSKGQIIGNISDKTEDNKLPHLHFEIREKTGDKEGKALDPTNLFVACNILGNGDFSAHTTTLTKEMFVSKWRNYCNTNSCNTYFLSHAELIYDASKLYNINPEFVVTRAMSEGYSPGGSTYNYWGIGCTNTGGLAACHSYMSLKDGIKGLANLSIIKNANTVSEVMKTYAYIGDYWYNPGDWGSGGCVYYQSISKYLSSSRAATVSLSCSSNRPCSGSTCLKTTDEDQNAYATWQVDDKMGKNRTAIWGLGN